MIETQCACGRVIKTLDENAGKKARCPECGEVLRLPGSKAESKPAKSSRKAATAQPTASKSTSTKVPEKSARRAPRVEAPAEKGNWEADEYGDGLQELPRLSRKKFKAPRTADKDAGAERPEKPAAADDSGGAGKSLLIGGGITGALAIAALVVFVIQSGILGTSGDASTSGKPSAELELVDFMSEHGDIGCLYPKGWEVDSGGGQGGVPAFAKFEKKGAKIHFRSSPSGAAFQMMAQPNGPDGEERDDELKPVSRIHEIQRKKFEVEVSGYKESGKPEMFNTAGFSEGRLSEFTASEGLVGSVYGFRATLLGNRNQWIVVCKCPPSQWKANKAVFRKILESAKGM